MTKKLLFTALTLVGFLSANAQEKGTVEFGAGLGVNFSTVSNGQENAKSLTGMNLAGSGEYYFSDRWGIKAKLIYDAKGWADGFIIDTDNQTTTITDFKLNYLTIPVMANYHFGSNRNWYLHFGPYVGFLVNAKDSKLGMDLKEGFESTDFGLGLGIGYKFAVDEKLKLFIEYDGQSGFSDVFANNTGSSVLNSRSSFNVGVLFILK